MLHPPAGQIGNQHRHTAAGWCPSRCPWAAAGHSRASKQRRLPHQHTRHRPLLRAPRGPRSLAAVPVGAGGRGQDLAGLQNDADHPPAHQAPPVWRVPEGPEGLVGLRDRRLRAAGSRMEGTARPAWPAEPGRGAGGRRQSLARLRDRRLRAEGSRVAISRAGRRPPAHSSTPQRNEAATGFRPRPRRAQSVPLRTTALRRSTPLSKAAPPAIRRSCPRGPRPRRGQPRGGRRGRGTGSRTRSRHPRYGRSGSTAGRHRARHTRRA